MKLNNKFWLFAFVCTIFTAAIAATLAILFWRQLLPDEQQLLIHIFKQQFWYFFSTGVFLFAAFGFTLDWFFRFYILPLNQLIEETKVMNTVNPAHRLKIDGSREVRVLSELINIFGDQFQSAKHLIDQTVESAKAKIEAEKNILATIMAELTQGVLICDAGGRILLYNRQAQRMLEKSQDANDDGSQRKETVVPEGFIGLKRSIYALIDEHLIQYALKDIQNKMDQKKENISSHFMMVTRDRRQLRVETLPILDEDHRFAGFVLIFSDITHQLEYDGRFNQHLKDMAKTLRSSTASIRSIVDLMIQFPEMDIDQKKDFLGIISAETLSLSRILGSDLSEADRYARSRWPLSPILVTDFIATLNEEVAAVGDLPIEVTECDSRCMIKVDGYALITALEFILNCLKNECHAVCSRIRLSAPGNLVQLDLMWPGEPIKIETLRQWIDRALNGNQKGYPLTLKEVLDHHHAEIWPHTPHQQNGGHGCLRLFIPMVQSESMPHDIRQVTILPKGRPEFYDFDLFNQAGQTPEMENRLLTELVYTVFDTETTGLDPRGGDEIISIGAIRVVNGRLLTTETVNQLVNPCRSVPFESIKVHGIDDAMLADKPTIDKVLPFFHRFAKNTVLIAHNAAFDMRMLQMKEKATGIRFINPVLDTMHLSAVIHPAHSNHNLDAIAHRLGVNISKRHDALGDAIATGEVFLKTIPLLNEKGIFTLKEALLASQRTYYAKLKKY